MMRKRIPVHRGRLLRWAAGALLAAVWSTGWVHAQTTPAVATSSSGAASTVDPIPTMTPGDRGLPDPGIIQTGCGGCGGGCGLGSLCGPGELGSGGCGTCCYPGRNFCCSDCDQCTTRLGRLLCGFYQCVCCPDPCYDPCWLPVADTGFFVDAARPITQMRLRYEGAWGFRRPDRAEYFYARARTTPNQLEPGGICSDRGFGKGPTCIASEVDFDELSLYMEAAAGNFSIFTDIPYRNIDPQTGQASIMQPLVPAAPLAQPFPAGTAGNQPTIIPSGAGPLPNDLVLGPGGAMVPAQLPGTAPTMLPAGTRIPKGTVLAPGTVIQPGATTLVPQVAFGAVMPNPCCPESGFGDIILGTKSMLLDCCLMQITFQFKTFLPSGNFPKGLGTAHVSLEPSLLFNICCAKDTYLQGQLAYWIPVGGDELYQGRIFHMHYALNRVLWCPCPGVQLIGTAECGAYVLRGGNYTDPDVLVTGVVLGADGKTPTNVTNNPISRSARGEFAYVGPGARLFICEKLDFGVGSYFAITDDSFAQQQVRAEFRWRF